MFNALAIFTIVIREGIFSERSIEPMYVRCKSAFSASFSWDNPDDSLNVLTLLEKALRILFSSSLLICKLQLMNTKE